MVCEIVQNQMFKKFLIKNEFWMTKRNNSTWYVKHTPEAGGIYAKVLQKGVEIQYNNRKQIFTNFIELYNYLDRITSPSTPDDNQKNFLSIINRKMTSKILRTLKI